MKPLFLIFCFLFVFVYASDMIDINTASLEELEELSGVGPVIGQRIIDARPFSSVDDLLRVKGIGEKTLQKIKDQGLSYVENGAMAAEVATTEEKTATELITAINEPTKTPAVDSPPLVYYDSALKNQSYNRAGKGWQWSSLLTPGAPLPTTKKSDNSDNSNDINNESALAGISYNKTNPWFLFFTALAVTIISFIIVLFIKLKF